MDYKIFGCKVNKYYLNKWLNYFSKMPPLSSSSKQINTKLETKGIEVEDINTENILIATCVVTDRAKNKFIKETLKQISSWKHIYLTGCAAFDNGKKMTEEKFYKTYPELKTFQNKITLLWEEPERNDTRKIWTQKFKDTANIYTKKFIVIQNWCDNYCSFCLTIHKRGKSQNIAAEEIIQEINDFVEIGWKEIVITGINLAARWCKDTKKPNENKFAELLQTIIVKTNIERIRISSLWPEFLNDEFFEVIKNTRFLPHFHISIQSFSNNILKSMNRNYDSNLLDNIISKLKNLDRPDKDKISIWGDIIIGFPWETEEDFQDTVKWIQKHQINKVHAFPFSAHDKWETIPAHSFQNQVPQEIKKQREKELKEITDKIREEFIQKNTWKKHQVLIEEKRNEIQKWWTENYIQVELDWNHNRWEIIEIVL